MLIFNIIIRFVAMQCNEKDRKNDYLEHISNNFNVKFLKFFDKLVMNWFLKYYINL